MEELDDGAHGAAPAVVDAREAAASSEAHAPSDVATAVAIDVATETTEAAPGPPRVRCHVRVGQTASDERAERRLRERMYALNKAQLTPVKPTLTPVRDWFGGHAGERVSGVPTQIWEASTRLTMDERVKVNSFHVRGTFEEYVAAAERGQQTLVHSEPLVLPVDMDGAMKAAGLRKKADDKEGGSAVRARLWLASRFPLTFAHFALLLDVISVASKRARRLRSAVARLDEAMRDAFPMKLHVPLLLTVWASVTCTAYRPLDPATLPDDWFDVPKAYTRRESSVENVASELGLAPPSAAQAPIGVELGDGDSLGAAHCDDFFF